MRVDMRTLVRQAAAEPLETPDPTALERRAERRRWTKRTVGAAAVMAVLVGGVLGAVQTLTVPSEPTILTPTDLAVGDDRLGCPEGVESASGLAATEQVVVTGYSSAYLTDVGRLLVCVEDDEGRAIRGADVPLSSFDVERDVLSVDHSASGAVERVEGPRAGEVDSFTEVAGRVGVDAASVVVVRSDGTTVEASVSGGYWLAVWPSNDPRPERIRAYDTDGELLGSDEL